MRPCDLPNITSHSPSTHGLGTPYLTTTIIIIRHFTIRRAGVRLLAPSRGQAGHLVGSVAGCNEFITLHRYQYLLIPYGPSNGVLCPVTTLSQPLSHGPHPLVTSHIYSPLTLVSSRIASVNRHAQSFTPTTQNTTSPLCRAATHRRKAPLLRPTSLKPLTLL